jgi:glutamate/aspartate transport system substrate-binding protein
MVENGEADAHVTTDNLLYGLRMNAKDPTRYEVVGDHLSFSPVAIVLRKDDPEFKRVVDRLLTGLMLDGAIGRFYTKWFQSPIPPKGLVLGIPMSGLLRDQLRWPSDWSGD